MIRPYRAADLDAVLDVWYEASLLAHDFLGIESLAAERDEVAGRWLPMAETIVFDDDGRVVGFLSLIGSEVGGLFVHPDHQRRGIGRALLDRARVSRPFLELDVFEANAGARRFYASCGFEPVGRHVHAPTGQVEVRLRLELPTATDSIAERAPRA